MDTKRRLFLKGSAGAGLVGAALSAGLLAPRQLLAAWPETAFKATVAADAMSLIAGTADPVESSDIQIKAPDIAENGAVVPITVSTSIAGISSISIVTENNPTPLSASFVLGPNTEGFVSTRIKMGKTSNVIALVKTADAVYSARKEVKVTIGGCGG